MRTARVFDPQSRSFKPDTMLGRAFSFSAGATASSRSRNTKSALLAAAFAIIFVLVAGVDNSERRSRELESLMSTLRSNAAERQKRAHERALHQRPCDASKPLLFVNRQ